MADGHAAITFGASGVAEALSSFLTQVRESLGTHLP